MLSCIERPLRYNSKKNMFKMFVMDTGLLVTMLGAGTRTALLGDLDVNNGAIAENCIQQMLRCNGLDTFYFNDGVRKMKIDFITEIDGEICAVEVKSGKNRRSRSIHKLQNDEDVGKHASRWIIFSESNISIDEFDMEHYPLFCAAFIDPVREPLEFDDSDASRIVVER